jgi:hypothetical protein
MPLSALEKIYMDKKLIKHIERWIADFEATQPSNLCIDEDTFEGSAYSLLRAALAQLRRDGKTPSSGGQRITN